MEVDIPVVAMTEVRQAHIPHAVFVEALESVQVAMDGAANGAVLVLHRFRLADMDKLSVMQWQ